MTPSQELREHALYHRTGWVIDLPSTLAYVLSITFITHMEATTYSDPATSIERRMFLLFVAEALENP